MSANPEEGISFETKTFTWKMKLSKLLDQPHHLDSPHFLQGTFEWYLSIYHSNDVNHLKKPERVFLGENNWIEGYLHREKIKNKRSANGSPKIQGTFRIRMEIDRSESKNLKNEKTASWGISNNISFPKFLQFDPKSVGPDDNLIVKCKIWTKDGPGDRTAFPRLGQNSRSSLCVRIQGLLEDSILSDLTIQVGGEELKAHKSILAAQSPVFRRMFESEMVEATNSRIIIQDFSAKVFQQMLDFMYSGDESFIGKNGVSLTEMLQIAEKYEFLQLKSLCEDRLGNNLTVENVIEMLIFADMQNAPALKKQAIKYVVKKSGKVFKTKAYLEMKSIGIMQEICSAMAKKPH